MIKNALFAAMLTFHFAYAQETRISRTVNNQPVSFATIMPEGTAKATSANEEGDFELKIIPSGNYILTRAKVFS